MSNKRVSVNERARQLVTLEAVKALKAEVEARAFAKAARPRAASLKSLSEFEKLVPGALLEIMKASHALPAFKHGRYYRSGRCRGDLTIAAVRVWGFR